MAKILTRVTILLATVFVLKNVHCENTNVEKSWTSSIVGMKELLKMENLLLSAMESYAQKLEHKLKVIRGAFAESHAENLKSHANPEEYLSNPINSYALIRRLHEDWVNWEIFIDSSVGTDQIKRIEELRVDLPTDVDLYEASEAIYRLNTIYYLHPANLAVGLINGKQYDTRLKSIDCFNIGYFMFKEDMFDLSDIWLNVSLQLYKDSDNDAALEFAKIKILELHTQVLIKQLLPILSDRLIDALETIDNALYLSPHKAQLLQMKAEIELNITTSSAVVEETTEQFPEKEESFESIYKTHCRQYTYRPRFHCLYNKTTTAFLQLAPLKMEILNLDPYVVLYHDVISDAEISTIKIMADSKLERTVTSDFDTDETFLDNTRVSQGYWFYDETSDIIKRIHQRISDITGFDLWDSEQLQIMNYGMSGQYQTHVDFFNTTPTSVYQPEEGDRIATVVFYLSDVEQGGVTVFPELELGVYPKKGSALMWYNLNNRGEADLRTKHSSCPVIVGSKWILTKWIRQYSQMFRRRCYG